MTNKRISLASKIIRRLPNASIKRIVDIGARDCGLGKAIDDNYSYFSVDLYQNSNETINLVGDAQKISYEFVESSDLICILDVLEHLDDMHSYLHKVFSSKCNTFLICLPNISHYYFRLNYLLKGSMPGGKYSILSDQQILDRHRWLTTYHSSNKLINIFSEMYGLSLTQIDCTRKFREMNIKMFPSLRVWASFYLLQR